MILPRCTSLILMTIAGNMKVPFDDASDTPDFRRNIEPTDRKATDAGAAGRSITARRVDKVTPNSAA